MHNGEEELMAVVIRCGGETRSGRSKITRRAKSVKAGTREARSCSIEHRGYWADVVHRGRVVASCINGRCQKGG